MLSLTLSLSLSFSLQVLSLRYPGVLDAGHRNRQSQRPHVIATSRAALGSLARKQLGPNQVVIIAVVAWAFCSLRLKLTTSSVASVLGAQLVIPEPGWETPGFRLVLYIDYMGGFEPSEVLNHGRFRTMGGLEPVVS